MARQGRRGRNVWRVPKIPLRGEEGPFLQLHPSDQRPAQRELVGVVEVATDR